MEEEVGQDGPIECIFLCEFHPTRGPLKACQYPENYAAMSKELFETISVYLIPKPQIKKCIITVNVSGLKITGYPNEIINSKYARNAYIFNLCFVCDSKTRTVQYEPVVKKLSEYLENLELENQFLSNEGSSKKQLPKVLEEVLKGLNSSGKCTIRVILYDKQYSERRKSCKNERKPDLDYNNPHTGISERRYSLTSDKKKVDSSQMLHKNNTDNRDSYYNQAGAPVDIEPCIPYVSVLHLKKIVNIRPDQVQAQDHHVPILICSRSDTLRLSHHWDLTTQQVLTYIDGLSHIAKIAAEADVDVNLVKACIQNLVYYRIVKLLPIFQYTNMYTALPGLHKLYTNKEVQEDCLKTICKSLPRLPSVTSVLQLYSSLTYGVSVRDLCLRFNPLSLNIDERKLIQYGVLHGFIRRLHQYPIYHEGQSAHISSSLVGPFHRMCNGLHSIDEICCKFGMTYQEVNERLDRDSNVTIILK